MALAGRFGRRSSLLSYESGIVKGSILLLPAGGTQDDARGSKLVVIVESGREPTPSAV